MRVRWMAPALAMVAAARVLAATPQEQVEARRKANPKVVIHVISGETLTGSIERTMKDEFYLASENGMDRTLVPYFAVKALIDPDTGETIPLDAPKEPPLSTSAAVAAAEKAAGGNAASAPTRSALPLPWLFAIGGIAAMWYAFSRYRKD